MARQRQITKQQIVDASIAIGLSQLSMHRLAKNLGVSATALYRHVANREELIQLCCDHILLQLDFNAQQPWQETLVDFAHQFRTLLLENHGAVDYLRHNQRLTTGSIRLTEHLIAPLHAAGFSADEAFTAYMMVYTHVTDMVSHQEQSARIQNDSQMAEPNDQIPSELDDYPQLAWLLSNRSAPDHNQFFCAGLQVVMSGLNALYQSKNL